MLDGTVGQNAVQQGKLFAQAVSPTGIVVTKLDGSARGGAVAALRRELDLPIRFLGVGEGAGRPSAVRRRSASPRTCWPKPRLTDAELGSCP